MRKIGLGLALLLGMVIGLFLGWPWIAGLSIELTCKQPSESCLTRMRAMGNVWSLKGDMVRAEGWYARAAADGDAASMFNLGWLYEQAALHDVRAKLRALGNDADLAPGPNFARALEWYGRAADKGFAPAMNNLGQLYLGGLAGPAEPEKAIAWMLAAAKAGNPVAAMYVSVAYLSGEHLPVDRAQSQFWSTWTPSASSARDLVEPIFARTGLNGMPLPVEKRAEFRAAAETGRPVTTTFRPMTTRDPSLPTFKSVQRKLESRGTKDAR